MSVLFAVFLFLFKKEPRIFKKLNSKFEVVNLFKFMFGKSDLLITMGQSQYKYQPKKMEEDSNGIIMSSSGIIPFTQNIEEHMNK